MMAYAMDTPAPATIFLISGDRDFVYAISVLALRQYRVILLSPKSAHSSLKAQADANYLWPDHFMTFPPRSLELPTSSTSNMNVALISLKEDEWPPLSATPSSFATSCISTYQPPPVYSPGENTHLIRGCSPIRDETSRALSIGCRTFGIAKTVTEAVRLQTFHAY